MARKVCLVHYHEIGLKGKNRSTFENRLVTNLRRSLGDYPVEGVRRISGHVLVTFEGEATVEEAHAISRVPGVARVSLAYLCGLDEGSIAQLPSKPCARRVTSSPSRCMPAGRPRPMGSIPSTLTASSAPPSARSSLTGGSRCTSRTSR